MIDVVNVVGSGDLDIELDLEILASEIGEPRASIDPARYPGLNLRLDGDAPLITVHRSGKYIITGAASEEESFAYRDEVLRFLFEMGVIETPEDEGYTIQNFVCIADMEQPLNLSALAISLGLERTEYEPEQFPGLIYRPDSKDGVVLLFGTGRVVITGCRSEETAERIFTRLTDSVSTLL